MPKRKPAAQPESPEHKPTPADGEASPETQPAPTPVPAPAGTPEATSGEPGDASEDVKADRRELTKAQDQLLRLRADFDNFRKRMQRERVEMARTANEALIQELLPVVDHMDLALAADVDNKQNPYAEGFRMVREQLLGVLRQFAVEPLQTEGNPFDPNLHDAISHLPSNTVPENTVLAQTRRGFLLDGRLLRPAQVVVSSGAATPDEDVTPTLTSRNTAPEE